MRTPIKYSNCSRRKSSGGLIRTNSFLSKNQADPQYVLRINMQSDCVILAGNEYLNWHLFILRSRHIFLGRIATILTHRVGGRARIIRIKIYSLAKFEIDNGRRPDLEREDDRYL